jgi:hypothetical protein
MISRELRDALAVYVEALRVRDRLGDRMGRGAERIARVARTREHVIEVMRRERLAQHRSMEVAP